MKRFILLFVVCAMGAGFAPRAYAAQYSSFEVSGWIPYWRSATGTLETLNHLDSFKEVDPFGYTVKNDGTLNDAAGLEASPSIWTPLKALAKADQIRFIPTVMWSNGAAIDKVLRSPKLRAAHENAIVAAVKKNGYDGIDLDYEAKLAATQPYFSLFIKELSQKLGSKWLMCTIEARTPADARADSTPDDPKDYANDYGALNKYCDRVRIMAYDQASVDQKLTLSTSAPYIPVADPRWVEDVVTNAMKSIDKSKIMIGVPTYGYEYKVTPLSSGYDYQLLWPFDPKYALDLAAASGASPSRNAAGELSFIYHPQDATADISPNTASASAGASGLFDNSFNIVWWSDAQAIRDKVLLAKKLGVRGVSVFKIDGGEDQGIWQALK